MIDPTKAPFLFNGSTFPTIGGFPALISREDMFGSEVASIRVQALAPVDDDIRVRVQLRGTDGVLEASPRVLSDTQYRVSWYYGETFGYRGPFNPLWNSEGFRALSFSGPQILAVCGRPLRTGDIISLDAFEGGGSWRTNPVQTTITYRDGAVQTATVGVDASGFTGANPSHDAFPAVRIYYALGTVPVAHPSRCCTCA